MWLYSNLANGLLVVAEERVAQSSYDSIVVSQIAGPLGLADTRVTLSAAEQADLAEGYQADGQPAAAYAVIGASLGAGGLRSNAKDLAAYLVANIDPSRTPLAQVLGMTQQRQSFGPKSAVAMGLGWLIANPGAPTEQFSKDGATTGFNTYIAFSRATRTGFAVVCNGHNVTTLLARQINNLLGATGTESDDTP
jgi:D-alanyl-D-alanine-carboxypeptidase/D-alanyl-D-alanine-endopeptidase